MFDSLYNLFISPGGMVLFTLIGWSISILQIFVLCLLVRACSQLVATTKRIQELQDLHLKMTGELIDLQKGKTAAGDTGR